MSTAKRWTRARGTDVTHTKGALLVWNVNDGDGGPRTVVDGAAATRAARAVVDADTVRVERGRWDWPP